MVRHPLLAQHLLEHVPELCVLRLVRVPRRLALPGEEVPGPRVRLLRAGAGNAGVGLLVREGVGPGRGGVGAALEVVFAAAGTVGQGVVGVIDELEAAGAGLALGAVGRDAVRVEFQGRASKGVSGGYSSTGCSVGGTNRL